jgi:phosphohistidine phosphatase
MSSLGPVSVRLLVIRHAIAEDRAEFARSGQDDSQRPLTHDGARRMRKGARGLRVIVPEIGLLASSPYVRATQTAEIIAQAYGEVSPVTTDTLIPTARPRQLLAWVRSQRGADPVAVVGHEPHLTRVVSWLLTEREDPILVLKKGGACLLEFDAAIRAGAGVLRWVFTPGQLRKLAS